MKKVILFFILAMFLSGCGGGIVTSDTNLGQVQLISPSNGVTLPLRASLSLGIL